MKRKLVEKSTTPPIIGDSSIIKGTTICFKSIEDDTTKWSGIVNDIINDRFGNTVYTVNEATSDNGNVRKFGAVDSKNVIGII